MLTKMKLALVTSIGLIAGVAGIAAANGDGGGAPGDGQADVQSKHAERRAERLAKYDTNKDGKLDASERAAMKLAFADKRFAKLDSNGDGVISKAEFEAGAQNMHRHHRGGFDKGQ